MLPSGSLLDQTFARPASSHIFMLLLAKAFRANMPSPRSFFTARQCHLDDNNTEQRRTNGRFWARRYMNETPSDPPTFSSRSMSSSMQSSATMQQTEEQSKPLPNPNLNSSSHEGLAQSEDYAGRMFRKFHHHTISDATTGSNTSSPTTTISTVDDSSATEPSPASSPESPPPATFSTGMIRPHTADDGRPFFELQKQAPPKKGRNLKNLAVDTSRGTSRAASTTSLPLPALNADSLSNGVSPAFVKPPTPPKRKPSNLGLTLLTPAMNKALPQEIKLAIPPTPANSRPGALRHFQSSPSLPLLPELKTQGFGAPTRVHTTLETIFSPAGPAQKPFADEEEEQNFDIPLSKEEKPEAYPDGPICVYDSGIDLYLEPTAKQAMEYDVVLNVASEVRNPLVEHDGPDPTKNELRIDGGGGIQLPPRREQEPAQGLGAPAIDSSPATPKATPLVSTFAAADRPATAKEPEYIHIKWEHNSDIVPDLLRLVKLIDEKVTQGKRTLVHCQCGVSRSASLVVAYGLYKNPSLSVQQAYDAVKKRSKWIGPNMNLIMQLQEFRSSLMHGGLLPGNRGMTPITPSSQFKEWSRAFPAASPTGAVPATARVTNSTAETLAALSLGPSSAPSGKPWLVKETAPTGQRARAISAVKPGTAYVNTSGRVVPMVPVLKVVEPDAVISPVATKPQPTVEDRQEDSSSATPTEAIASPRSEEFAMTPLNPSPEADPADAFGLMSPSSTEFASSPFDRPTLLASLGMGPVRQQDDVVPRRTSSLTSRPKPKPAAERSDSLITSNPPRLRNKISSPSIREQQQLQSMQAKIEASLPHHHHRHATASYGHGGGVDEPLMSPRATEFTQNPFALALPTPSPLLTPPEDPPRTPGVDPRSPAHKGVSPITRSILDVL